MGEWNALAQCFGMNASMVAPHGTRGSVQQALDESIQQSLPPNIELRHDFCAVVTHLSPHARFAWNSGPGHGWAYTAN